MPYISHPAKSDADGCKLMPLRFATVRGMVFQLFNQGIHCCFSISLCLFPVQVENKTLPEFI